MVGRGRTQNTRVGAPQFLWTSRGVYTGSSVLSRNPQENRIFHSFSEHFDAKMIFAYYSPMP